MNDHLQALLAGRQYSESLKGEATMRVIFGGEAPHGVIRILDIHNIYVLNNWVTAYRKQIETGLITLPPMTEKQRPDLQELRQHNKELERSLKDANLMILAPLTMSFATKTYKPSPHYCRLSDDKEAIILVPGNDVE